ncbi:hypothetical protein ANCCAN_02683 [Ancylostoma caninum]|uniref:ET module n=1 Tax=Ancylostoma caninum TaxID=29170 RepID=A0A368H5T7_ANCCA|nr:hypothetical protein ANCCAN_02683 [Ancylostoma caninum]
MLSLAASLLIFLFGNAASLDCYNFMVGNMNGTVQSNQASIACDENIHFCMTLNGTINLPSYQFQGTVGQCDGLGQPSAMLKNIFGFSCWREGCEMMPLFSLTRCCCSSNMCNTEQNIKNITGLNDNAGNPEAAFSVLLLVAMVKLIW